ncbi:MAG: NDP-sugar synthase [Candidatus Lokiarchaeota archaeon]|nr:NDP-sugar synthase [Candidatus Lokiarchaeota archaeon]
MVNAIILAGGYGTRLRPITCSIPKPMLPVINKPLLSFVISRLLGDTPDLKRVVIAVNYRAHEIEAYFEQAQKELGCEIHVVDEKKPMGTGGALKYSQKLLEDDSTFMLNGDVVTYFSYKDMHAQHKRTKALATISAIRVEDVSRYGVLVSEGGETEIREFYEKPRTTELIKRYSRYPVNAGTYLLEPAIFDYMEPGQKLSIEKDVFPRVAGEGKAHKFEFSGIWKDFGLPDEYLAGNFIILEEELKRLGKDSIVDPSASIDSSARVIPPVCLDAGVKVGRDCTIGPRVVLGRNCEIGEGASIQDSVFLENCIVDARAEISQAILGDGVKAGVGVHLAGPAVLGSNVYIEDQVTLKSSQAQTIKVCPWVTLTTESVEHAKNDGAFVH